MTTTYSDLLSDPPGAAQTIMCGGSAYAEVSELGQGSFGVTKLMRHTATGELVAVKFIERGPKVNEYVERELANHRQLIHPHIIQFKEVFLTPSHLAIVMEYAAGGELFDFLAHRRFLTENEARFFFQQLICGLAHCHAEGVCHRDLKLENTLLDGSEAPRLKICDFGYSKHAAFDSHPKSIVGTRAYIAPEIILSRFNKSQYNGEAADVWSAGVMLYLMLVGSYPFEDRQDPANLSKTIQRICCAQYDIPPVLRLSAECVDLLSRILVAAPAQRIGVAGICAHPWFLRNLPGDLQDGGMAARAAMQESRQSPQELQSIMAEARVAAQNPALWTNGHTTEDHCSPVARMDPQEAHYKIDTKHTVKAGDDGSLWRYMVQHSHRPTPELDELQQLSLKHRRGGMCSPPDSIPILQMLVRLTNARRVVEVGVFTGYTALGMALALPAGGKLIACDITDEFPSIGKPFWDKAGVTGKIDLRIAPAVDTLEALLKEEGEGSVDMGFIDADKSNYDAYYEALLKLLRPGGVIAVDNVLWDGRVIDKSFEDDDTKAIRALNDKIINDDRVHVAMLSNSDGITLCYKK